jgi:hypothetical protein
MGGDFFGVALAEMGLKVGLQRRIWQRPGLLLHYFEHLRSPTADDRHKVEPVCEGAHIHGCACVGLQRRDSAALQVTDLDVRVGDVRRELKGECGGGRVGINAIGSLA